MTTKKQTRKKKAGPEPRPADTGCIMLPVYLEDMLRLVPKERSSDNDTAAKYLGFKQTCRLSGNADGWELTVTDGRTLFCVRGGRVPEALCKEHNEWLDGVAHNLDALAIPAAGLLEHLKAARKCGNHLGVKMHHYTTGKGKNLRDHWLVHCSDGTTKREIVCGDPPRWPDWKKMLPKVDPIARVRVSPDRLASLLRAMEVTMERGEESVYLCFYPRDPGSNQDKPIALVGVTEGQQTIDAFLMPISGAGPFDKKD